MTFHTVRTVTATGYVSPHSKPGTVAIMARVTARDFAGLRRLAARQQVPLAHVIRRAINQYLHGKGRG